MKMSIKIWYFPVLRGKINSMKVIRGRFVDRGCAMIDHMRLGELDLLHFGLRYLIGIQCKWNWIHYLVH